ncbi:hypothetical protein [Sphingomonas sp.]|jgi:hypothetical protein|uniref:hypothetical protein n=1 Tax=Sphingomonas sp. TaxID=28214 RepID=UPI003566B5AC
MSQKFILEAKHPNRDNVKANMHRFIDSLPETKSWEAEFKLYRKDRTDPQNNALWGVAYPPLAKELGYQLPELHETFCRSFFGEVTVEIAGRTWTKPRRTTTTNEQGKRDLIKWDEFKRFYALVQQTGAEMGVFIPDPDPLWRQHQEEASEG